MKDWMFVWLRPGTNDAFDLNYQCCWSPQARAKIQEAIDVGGDAEERLEDAVLAGISEARQRVLSEPSSAPQESSSSEHGGDDTEEQHAQNLQQSVQDSKSRSDGNKEKVSDDQGVVNSKRELVDSRNQSQA